jgi:hypothetical protein
LGEPATVRKRAARAFELETAERIMLVATLPWRQSSNNPRNTTRIDDKGIPRN